MQAVTGSEKMMSSATLPDAEFTLCHHGGRKRGRNGWRGERIIQCGEEARPNKTCHTSISENEQAHTESALKVTFF